MPRRDLKAGAMFWFASAKSQGQNREAGLQEFSVKLFGYHFDIIVIILVTKFCKLGEIK